MAEEKEAPVNENDMSDEDLEALFAAEVAKEKEQQRASATKDDAEDAPEVSSSSEGEEEEPSEEELEAMFAAEVARETAAKSEAPATPTKAPAPAPAPKKRNPVPVKSAKLPEFDNIPGQRGTEPPKDANLEMILDIPVDVHVEVGHTRVRVQEILRLDIGSVVELNRVAGHPADIIVNGKLIGQGDVVVVNENFGIRVTRLVGLEERLSSL